MQKGGPARKLQCRLMGNAFEIKRLCQTVFRRFFLENILCDKTSSLCMPIAYRRQRNGFYETEHRMPIYKILNFYL